MSQKIGPREQKLRDMRAGTAQKARIAAVKAIVEQALAKPAEERPVAKKSKTKKRAAKKSARKTRATGKDRSPLAVGTFIVGGGEAGRTMAALEKHFGIEAHPMRSKIFAARHEHGFTIAYDAKAKAYVGSAPKGAAPTDPAALEAGE